MDEDKIEKLNTNLYYIAKGVTNNFLVMETLKLLILAIVFVVRRKVDDYLNG